MQAGSAMEELAIALDAMHNMRAVFYSRYTFASAVERRAGGQGVVQFADINGTKERAVVKFYLQREAFTRERQLYTESELKTMMPSTLAVEENASGQITTPYGYKFPPFVIIEAGQSLDEWARVHKPDFITTFQVLSHIVKALQKLHGHGYAHRDIKPGNILRRPAAHDWTLIDFGCAAPIGAVTALSFSLKYAAPETVQALETGRKTIKSDPAVDVWAVGVIAYELLTGERAFPVYDMSSSDHQSSAQAALAGRTKLPWEGYGVQTEARLQKLRGLRRTVLKCLDRQPDKRPTAEALLRSWDYAIDNMVSGATTVSANAV